MIATFAAPLGATSPQAALALYDLARTSGAASAYEAAAHALARALQRQMTIAATLRPAAPLSAALGAPSEAQAAAPVASKPKRRSAKAAQVEDDLAALFSRPSRAKAATGSFWAIWTDGTATRVTGVVYHGDKPQSRWSAALQAADTLRRLRNRRDLARQLQTMNGGAPVNLTVRTSCGVEMDSPDWQRLAMVQPMAPLAAIFDEVTGETFSAPPGGRYGAGDVVEARAIEARLITPRLSWHRSEPDPRPASARKADALSAFPPVVEAVQLETALPGDPAPGHLSDLHGRAVVIAAQQVSDALANALADWNSVREPLAALRERMQEAREAAQRPNAVPEDAEAYRAANEAFSAVLSEERAAEERITAAHALESAVKRFAANEAGDLIRWTVRRLAGGFAFRLTASNGHCVTFDAERVKALRLAA